MDGLSRATLPTSLPPRQATLRSAIGCVGIGLHGGQRVHLTLQPAACDHGIAFRRSDLPGRPTVAARWDRVVDTRMCTVLADGPARVGTVEHLMAALATAGVTNALIDVDGPECPILDGSAAPFVFLIDCAGVRAQEESVAVVTPVRPVRVTQGAAWAELRPAIDPDLFDLSLTIAFDAAAIGTQSIRMAPSEATLRHDLIRARTFTLAGEVAQLRAAGLARGGSLENAVVVDGARVLNPGGWRMADECVRHKALDVIGDLALSGVALRGRFSGHCSGHALNNQLLRALFDDAANWRRVETAPLEAEIGTWRAGLSRAA